MRLVELLIHLLEAHAQTLQRLAALFGEETLLAMLEKAGEAMEAEAAERGDGQPPPAPRFDPKWFEPVGYQEFSSPYAELEGAVRDLDLPAMLEFHLWAYPPYRAFIESEIELDARIPGPGADIGTRLVDDAVDEAEAWLKRLLGAAESEELAEQARRAAHMPWLRFRTQVLKRVGKRPLGPVY